MRQSIFALLFCGCINATVSDTITKTTEVQINNPYPSSSAYNLPPITLPSQVVPFDMSKTLSDIGKVGQLSFVVDQHSIHSNSGDFSFVDEVKITLTPDNNNSSGLPELTVIDAQLTNDQKTSTDLQVSVLPDSSTLLQYFDSGGLNMNFSLTVSGHPPQSIDITDTLMVDVALAVNKSTSDL